MATPLDNLYNKVPGLDPTAERQARSAANIQLKQQASQTLAQPQAQAMSGVRQAQAIAPAAVQSQAQAGAQAQQQQQAMLGQQAQLALGQQQSNMQAQSQRAAIEQQAMLAQRERAQFEELAREQQASKRKISREDIAAEKNLAQQGLILDNNVFLVSDKQYKDLAAVDRGLAQKVFDDRRVFRQSEMGREFSNELQLLDYAAFKAKSEQEFKDYATSIQRELQRRDVMFDAVLRDMKKTLERGYISEKNDLDRKTRYQIESILAAMEKDRAKKAEEAAKQQALIQGAITAVTVGAILFCLPGDTAITTPHGHILISHIKAGDIVKTPEGTAKVIELRTRPTPEQHQLVQITLADGRHVTGSLTHPFADGRWFGNIREGDIVDGSRVNSTKLIPYGNRQIYDILLDDEKHVYLINDIPVASTLNGR